MTNKQQVMVGTAGFEPTHPFLGPKKIKGLAPTLLPFTSLNRREQPAQGYTVTTGY